MAMSDVCDGMPEFVTAGELAEMFSVSDMTIYRLVEAEELSAVRLGRVMRIQTQSVRDYLDREEVR